MVSLCKRLIPGEIRISAYILIIATFVTVADLTLQALVPDIHKALGALCLRPRKRGSASDLKEKCSTCSSTLIL